MIYYEMRVVSDIALVSIEHLICIFPLSIGWLERFILTEGSFLWFGGLFLGFFHQFLLAGVLNLLKVQNRISNLWIIGWVVL